MSVFVRWSRFRCRFWHRLPVLRPSPSTRARLTSSCPLGPARGEGAAGWWSCDLVLCLFPARPVPGICGNRPRMGRNPPVWCLRNPSRLRWTFSIRPTRAVLEKERFDMGGLFELITQLLWWVASEMAPHVLERFTDWW